MVLAEKYSRFIEFQEEKSDEKCKEEFEIKSDFGYYLGPQTRYSVFGNPFVCFGSLAYRLLAAW